MELLSHLTAPLMTGHLLGKDTIGLIAELFGENRYYCKI